jgi:hypothetical protein
VPVTAFAGTLPASALVLVSASAVQVPTPEPLSITESVSHSNVPTSFDSASNSSALGDNSSSGFSGAAAARAKREAKRLAQLTDTGANATKGPFVSSMGMGAKLGARSSLAGSLNSGHTNTVRPKGLSGHSGAIKTSLSASLASSSGGSFVFQDEGL